MTSFKSCFPLLLGLLEDIAARLGGVAGAPEVMIFSDRSIGRRLVPMSHLCCLFGVKTKGCFRSSGFFDETGSLLGMKTSTLYAM